MPVFFYYSGYGTLLESNLDIKKSGMVNTRLVKFGG